MSTLTLWARDGGSRAEVAIRRRALHSRQRKCERENGSAGAEWEPLLSLSGTSNGQWPWKQKRHKNPRLVAEIKIGRRWNPRKWSRTQDSWADFSPDKKKMKNKRAPWWEKIEDWAANICQNTQAKNTADKNKNGKNWLAHPGNKSLIFLLKFKEDPYNYGCHHRPSII
jgi:hypothetical protein